MNMRWTKSPVTIVDQRLENKQQKITVYAIFFKSEIHRDRILSIAKEIICFMSNM